MHTIFKDYAQKLTLKYWKLDKFLMWIKGVYGVNVFSLIFQSKFLNRMHILYEFKERCGGCIYLYHRPEKTGNKFNS